MQGGRRLGRWSVPVGLVSFISFFVAILMAMGVPVLQADILSECKDISYPIQVDDLVTRIDIEKCRFKTNINNEFGEWEIIIPNER